MQESCAPQQLTEKKETSYELFDTLFNKDIVISTIKIKINNIEYCVHKEILSKTSSFFCGLFKTSVHCDENTIIRDINNEEADPGLIETMFKILYTYYGNSCIKFKPVIRSNIIQKLNVYYVLKFIGFEYLDELETLHLDSFAKSVKQFYQQLFQMHNNLFEKTNHFHSTEMQKEVDRINDFLKLFHGLDDFNLLTLQNNYAFRFNNLVFTSNDDNWYSNLCSQIIKPAFPKSGLEFPVLTNGKPLYLFSLKAFMNVINLNDDFKVLAPLINFNYQSQSAVKEIQRVDVLQSILEIDDEDLKQYLFALYSFDKPNK